jgi:hypothetical protein
VYRGSKILTNKKTQECNRICCFRENVYKKITKIDDG